MKCVDLSDNASANKCCAASSMKRITGLQFQVGPDTKYVYNGKHYGSLFQCLDEEKGIV